MRALQELISAYEFGAEAPKMLVPFARVLRMWDENPADLDRWSTHRLHWHFKWVTSGMISHPSVPLSTMYKWLGEMEQRYGQRFGRLQHRFADGNREHVHGQRAEWGKRRRSHLCSRGHGDDFDEHV